MGQGPQIFFGGVQTHPGDATQPVSTIFGASGSSLVTLGSVDVLNLLHCKMTRSRVILKEYGGENLPQVDDYINKGMPVVLNCNVADVGRDKDGNKVPNPFITDLVAYRNLLEPVLKKYGSTKRLIFAIENEPTTGAFNTGPMSDYLAMLAVAVDLVHQYGGIVIDGGVHVETVNGADSTVGEGKAVQVAQLLQGYASIPLDFVNIHTHGEGDTYPAGAIKKATDKVKNLTGHYSCSNEWHTENGTPNLIRNMVQQWKDAAVAFSIYITIDNPDKQTQLNNGTTLTDIGVAYRDAIS